jgi:mannose-1-phosphate guanylyltransferase
MSRTALPKQLIPLLSGRSLLEVALERLEGVLPARQCWVCAGQGHAAVIGRALPQLAADRFLGEPCGRDTLNAIGLSAAVLAKTDPEAILGVFTADHVIEPVGRFRAIVESGYALVERRPETLVTFGIAPNGPATGYGYLELGEPLQGDSPIFVDAKMGTVPVARRLRQFREKPDPQTAQAYFDAGPDRFLWNSGMFVWRAETLLECIRRYAPDNHAGLTQIADAWDTPRREAVLEEIFPTLRKTSVDYAVMEPASRDAQATVVAIPMPLD